MKMLSLTVALILGSVIASRLSALPSAQNPASVIKAHEFQIINAKGQTVASLRADTDGASIVIGSTPALKRGIRLDVSERACSVSIVDEGNKVRAGILSQADGSASFMILDPKTGKPAAIMGLRPDGSSYIQPDNTSGAQ